MTKGLHHGCDSGQTGSPDGGDQPKGPEIGGGTSGYDRTDPYIGTVEAAFFDLDKTVIAKASIMAFAPDFRREGLLTRRTMAKGLWTQLVYVHVGASSRKMARIRRSVLSVSRGWDQGQIRRVVADKLTSAIDPITFAEAQTSLTYTSAPAAGCTWCRPRRGDRRAARPAFRSP